MIKHHVKRLPCYTDQAGKCWNESMNGIFSYVITPGAMLDEKSGKAENGRRKQ